MPASPAPTAGFFARHIFPATLQPTAQQQAVIDRITAQRLRWYVRHMAKKRVVDASISKNIPRYWLTQATVWVRAHPAAAAAAIGAVLAAGPRRVLRWSGIVLPILMRYMKTRHS